MTKYWSVFLSLVLIAIAIATGGGAPSSQASGTPTATAPSVVREVLSQGEPVAAPGEILQLVRFTIPPGLRLAVHRHPGMQTAWLESGTLQYSVVGDGVVTIVRASTGVGTPGASETLAAGQTTTFIAGDSWTEPGGMIHYAESIGDEPVVILVASLLTIDAAPAQVVNETGTPTS